MANNYCEFSEAFRLPEAAANDFVAIVDAGDDISKMPEWFVQHYGLHNESAQDAFFDDFSTGVNATYECDFLYVHAEDGYGNPEAVMDILADVLRHHDIDGEFYLSAAFTCSKPRVGEFGGARYLATKYGSASAGVGMLDEYLLDEISKRKEMGIAA